jgi:hypothetical protein
LWLDTSLPVRACFAYGYYDTVTVNNSHT